MANFYLLSDVYHVCTQTIYISKRLYSWQFKRKQSTVVHSCDSFSNTTTCVLFVDVYFDMCPSEYKSLIGLHVVCICNLVTLKG